MLIILKHRRPGFITCRGVAVQDEAAGHGDGLASEIDVFVPGAFVDHDGVTINCSIYCSLYRGLIGGYADLLGADGQSRQDDS